jgi:hypothetical protein
MYYLSYASMAVTAFDSAALQELLITSRGNNLQLGITGMLLYRDGEFMQVLEGEQAAVQTLYARIARDPRHHRTTTILEGPTDARHFPDWSMGFRDLRDPAVITLPGYSPLLDTPLDIEALVRNAPLYQRLLQSFRYDI